MTTSPCSWCLCCPATHTAVEKSDDGRVIERTPLCGRCVDSYAFGAPAHTHQDGASRTTTREVGA